jgi:hypothetical protein
VVEPIPLYSRRTKPDPVPPADLSKAAAAWWVSVESGWSLDVDELALLGEASRCIDRIEQARRQIKRDGLMVTGLHGRRVHPLLAVERDNRVLFARLLGQLGLKHS